MLYEWSLADATDAEICAGLIMQTEIGRFFRDPKGFFAQAQSEGTLYVSRDAQGDVAALLKYSPHGGFHRYPYVHVYAVDPRCQGRGIGLQLLTTFEKEILAPAEKVFLLVAEFNTRAHHFYEKCGYSKVGEISDFFHAGDTEWIMMKRLV